MKITRITDDFSVATAIGPDDLGRIAALGFRTVINNRMDGEDRAQPQTAAMRAAAEAAGLAYEHIPATKHELFTDPVVEATARALRSAEGPILAHCLSGTRSAIAWAAAMARERPVQQVLDTLSAAGLDLAFLRDDLDSQADRARWSDGLVADASAAPDDAGLAAA